MNDRQTIEVKTEEEMITQLKLLLANNYNVAICKHDNLLGCISYELVYEKQKYIG